MHRLFPAPVVAVAVAFALALAACGSADPVGVTAATPTTNGSDAAAIRALPPGQRSGVFLRAVRDSGHDCQQVTQASEQRVEGDGPAAWAVECDRRGRYLVSIDAGGIATVTPAAALSRG